MILLHRVILWLRLLVRRYGWFYSAIGVLVVIISVLLLIKLFRSLEKETTPKITIPKVEVISSSAIPTAVYLTLSGHTEASRRVTLRAQISGTVKEIPAMKGSLVPLGQDVVVFEEDNRLEKLQAAQSRVHQRELEYKASHKLAAHAFKAENALAEAKAEQDAARANLAAIQEEIKNTHIQAPFAGIFDQKFVERGDFLNVGDKVATILELDPLKVICHIAEKDIAQVLSQIDNNGAQATMRLACYFGVTLPATLWTISKSADPKTRTYQMELHVQNPGMKIPEGLTTEVILAKESIKAHQVASSVLTLQDNGVLGLKAVQEGKVVFYPVTIIQAASAAESGKVWVTGAPETIHLITVGSEFVREGDSVIALEKSSLKPFPPDAAS